MRSLLWKEWHEQSWKLAFGCLVLGAFAAIGLHARIIADEKMVLWVCLMGIGLLPVLSSTGLIPAERAEGSFESLLAMPVAPWRILAAKTLMGLLLCAGPLIASAAVSLAMASGRELTGLSMLDIYLRSTLATVSIFIWMVALTARLPSEARAALLAMGVLILWALISTGLLLPGVPRIWSSLSPFSFFYSVFGDLTDGPTLPVIVVVQLLMLSVVWVATVKLFNRS